MAETTAKAEGGASARPAISSDFETFLKMLAVQLQNQDPMNPIESSDYAVQLATFSSVEQQVRTNQLLEGMMAEQSVAGITNFAGWIGREARSPAPAWFDGANPIELAPSPQASGDAATLVVTDATGVEVARIPAPVSDDAYLWDGGTADGATLPPGHYAFALETYAEGELIATEAVDTYGRVSEARVQNGSVMLVLEGGVQIPASSVTGLREG